MGAEFAVEVGVPEGESEVGVCEEEGEGGAECGDEVAEECEERGSDEEGPEEWCAEESLWVGVESLEGVDLAGVDAAADISGGGGAGAGGDEECGEDGDEEAEEREAGGVEEVFGEEWFGELAEGEVAEDEVLGDIAEDDAGGGDVEAGGGSGDEVEVEAGVAESPAEVVPEREEEPWEEQEIFGELSGAVERAGEPFDGKLWDGAVLLREQESGGVRGCADALCEGVPVFAGDINQLPGLVIEEDDVIGDGSEGMEVVCDDDGGALEAVVCLADGSGGLAGGVHIESGGWFVVEDEGGVGGDGAGDGESLLLSAAEDIHGAVGGDFEFGEECECGGAGVRGGWCCCRFFGVVDGELDVFDGREFVDECEVLEDDGGVGLWVWLVIGRGGFYGAGPADNGVLWGDESGEDAEE